jgi:hypothetical protein
LQLRRRSRSRPISRNTSTSSSSSSGHACGGAVGGGVRSLVKREQALEGNAEGGEGAWRPAHGASVQGFKLGQAKLAVGVGVGAVEPRLHALAVEVEALKAGNPEESLVSGALKKERTRPLWLCLFGLKNLACV